MARFVSWRSAAATGFAAAVSFSMLGTVAASAATAPAPVTGLSLSSRDGVVYADWTPSVDTAEAIVCWQPDTPPSTPQDATATCSDPAAMSGFSFAGTAGTTYGVSVFAHDAGTGLDSSPTSDTVLAVDAPPLPPVQLTSMSYTSNSLYLTWEDDPGNIDTKDFVVDWAVGTAVPAYNDAAGHITSSSNFGVTGLTKGVVYTLAVFPRDNGGNVGRPALLRAATRSEGLWLRSTDAAGSNLLSAAATFGVSVADAQMNSAGHLRTVFTTLSSYSRYVYYRSRESGQPWNNGVALSGSAVGSPVLGAPPAGRGLLVAWSTADGVRYRIRTKSGWQERHTLTTDGADRVVGAVYDNRHGHVLVRNSSGTTRGLWYLSIIDGHVSRSRITGAAGNDVAAMTLDQMTGDVVIVDRHHSSSSNVLRFGAVRPAVTSAPTLHTWRTTSSTVDLRPTSVASDSGVVTVGLQRVTSGGSSLDGPYVIRGSATSHHSPVRVAGTTNHDQDVVVTSLQSGRVVIAWRRTSDSWSPSDLGVWTTTWTRAKSGGWGFASAKRRSTSAYDVPAAAFRDDAGHFYTLYVTRADDVQE